MASNHSKTNDLFENVTQTQKDIFYPAFHSLSDVELSVIIENFWIDYEDQLDGIVDVVSLKRGAFLIHDEDNLRPGPADSGDTGHTNQASTNVLSAEHRTLNRHEVKALARERRGEISSLTKPLLVTLATCAVGAIVQGWAQESLVGANLDWPVDLHIATRQNGSIHFDLPNGLKNFGLVNAIPYFAAGLLGAWVSDPLTEKYGRRTALFAAGLCSFAAPIGGYYCQTWQQLFVCRLIQGIGMGAKSSVVPVLESEVSPPRMRGKLLVSWQTFVGVGIFLGASANLVFQGQWRHQFGIAFVPALVLLSLCYVIRESPRWLIKNGNYGEAYIALRELSQTTLQAARDLYLIHAQLQVEERLFSSRSTLGIAQYKEVFKQRKYHSLRTRLGFWGRLKQLFTLPRNRRAVVGSCVAMAAQQFSGFNIYAFLATTIFGDNGIDAGKTLWFTFGFTATNALFSALAFFAITKLGRRTLMLWSLTLMVPLLILTGHYFNVGGDGSIITLILIYTAVYSPGAGVIPFMYSSEVFPVVHRQVGMSLAVSVNLLLAGALAMAVSQYPTTLNAQTLLGTFAGLDGFAAILVWLFMRSPEAAVSLEDMNYLFFKPSTNYIKYQVTEVLPWAFRKIFWFLSDGDNHKVAFVDDWDMPPDTTELGDRQYHGNEFP